LEKILTLNKIHLIVNLAIGGTELSFVKLLSASDLDEFSIKVIFLSEEGPVGKQMRNRVSL